MGQNDEKGKVCSGREKQGGPEDNSQDSLPLIGMKAGCNKHPEFINQDRETADYTDQEGKFEVGDKGFRKICIDKFDHLWLGRKEGHHEKAGNMLGKEIGKSCKQKYSSKRDKQPMAQFYKVA